MLVVDLHAQAAVDVLTRRSRSGKGLDAPKLEDVIAGVLGTVHDHFAPSHHLASVHSDVLVLGIRYSLGTPSMSVTTIRCLALVSFAEGDGAGRSASTPASLGGTGFENSATRADHR